MPILCFGGSFNPIHRGHLDCAQVVGRRYGYERVLLIPNAQPPHKLDVSDIAPAADRLAMCELAAGFANSAGPAKPQAVEFSVSDIETRRGGASYTLDTARELKARGIDSVNWLIGADMLMYLPNWHEAQKLLDEVHFVVMARPGWAMDWEQLPTPFRKLRENVVEAPLIDITATEIRRRASRGEPIDHLTPPPVARYIESHQLYRTLV